MHDAAMPNNDVLARAFGANLRRVRDRLGMTQEEFCERVGYDQSYLSQLENGKRGLKSLYTLAERLQAGGIDPLLLIGETSETDLPPDTVRAARLLADLPAEVRAPTIAALEAAVRQYGHDRDDDLAEMRELLAGADEDARESMLRALRMMAGRRP